jgi:hypothetical protein
MDGSLWDTLEMRKIRRNKYHRKYFSMFFHERAAIGEFDGLLKRIEAEKQARQETLSEFKKIFPELSNKSAEKILAYFEAVHDL